MSAGAFTDEAAVLGEPVSQPHQAAVVGEVVGEPSDEIRPVLGEPVLLANGLSSDRARAPVSASSSLADGAAINGAGERNAVANEFHDASVLSARPNGEEPASSEEATAEEGTRPSATERAGTGPEARQMDADAASAEIEVTHVLDDPSQTMERAGTGPEAQQMDADAASTEIEVTHVLDDPSQTSHPGSELPIDTPSSSLEPVLQEADVKSSDDAEGPSASNTSSGDGDEIASAAKEDELAESSGQSASELVLPEVISSEKVSMQDGDDDEAAPDSSLSHFHGNVSLESVPVDSSGRRSIPIKESAGDKSCTDNVSLDKDAFQVSENKGRFNDGKPLAEPEKSSHIKLPVIFTVVIAVVGVFAVSISRSRQ